MASTPLASEQAELQRHESVLVHRGYRYLRVALGLCLVAIVAYLLHDPRPEPNGGTWLGYTLGGLSLALVVFLSLLGIRKRRYAAGGPPVAEWVSAHVYLGGALVVLATLHSGFQLGWNVHSLGYVLLLLVVASGLFGLYAYLRYPDLITANRAGLTLRLMFAQIDELDRDIRRLSLPLNESMAAALRDAVRTTRVGGSLLEQLRGRATDCPTRAARRMVQQAAASEPDAAAMRQLLGLLVRKEGLLRRARRDVQLHAWLRIWLYVHVPLTFALFAALLAHVFSVFYYW